MKLREPFLRQLFRYAENHLYELLSNIHRINCPTPVGCTKFRPFTCFVISLAQYSWNVTPCVSGGSGTLDTAFTYIKRTIQNTAVYISTIHVHLIPGIDLNFNLIHDKTVLLLTVISRERIMSSDFHFLVPESFKKNDIDPQSSF